MVRLKQLTEPKGSGMQQARENAERTRKRLGPIVCGYIDAGDFLGYVKAHEEKFREENHVKPGRRMKRWERRHFEGLCREYWVLIRSFVDIS